MYEKFGFARQEDGSYEFRLFVPDSAVDRMQYVRGGPCRIVEVRVVGDFQDQVEKGRLMDIVLQHAYAFSGSTEGGPYHWLWQQTEDSPFIGKFSDYNAFGWPLDYHNLCRRRMMSASPNRSGGDPLEL